MATNSSALVDVRIRSSVFAESAEKALERFAQQPFDAVITDMRMPGMNGEQFLSKTCNSADLKAAIAQACTLRDLLTSDNVTNIVARIDPFPSLSNRVLRLLRMSQVPNGQTEDVLKVLAGMLQDVGQLLLSHHFPERFRTAVARAITPFRFRRLSTIFSEQRMPTSSPIC